ncbi:bacillithiol biosynthesis cysteine-adding enzyme BshC [Mechercharimyces sp. CAU 1602]|uniref:bacillithiol biosynthesis cysteine-adding enzyme BshC n=1 Tax=Mechercharimyces sp. CAU 1602 TaxID=2973933 RepID=UPI002162A3C0|nr:bacillithiol biosynthesis cysteine-adding enzyme BshC [Mechercharimyces sp. CAU 1602]MCS1350613.1 bacillithiol biosynthesis cysteine-adding enzyme BshC [Mechercharimyces sp. CAU 1602]
MEIEEIQLNSSQPLVEKYMSSFASVSEWFTYDPYDKRSYEQRLHRVQQRERGLERTKLVEVLKAYHRGDLEHTAVDKNIERLLDPSSVVVIGGQQAGLLTGPLYTLYKAISIIKLAKREEERLGVPVIPVFWIAGEDHDLEEINHVYLRGTDGARLQHVLSLDRYVRRSASDVIPEEDQLQAWIDQLLVLLPDTEEKQNMVATFKRLAQGGISIARFFARVMHELFQSYGLVQVDASFPLLRQQEAPFFQTLIKKSEEIAEAVTASTHKMKEHGYPVQLHEQPQHSNLFLYEHQERRPLFWTGNGFRTKENPANWSVAELLNLAAEEPHRLSTNVVTRPLMQEWVFPTLAVVTGPGEIAYWSLLRSAFTQVGLEMPILQPRSSWTLVDRTSQRLLSQYELTMYDIMGKWEEKRDEWLRSQFNPDVEKVFTDARDEMSRIHRELIAKVAPIRPDLDQLGETNRQRMKRELYYLEHKVWQALRERHALSLSHFDELKEALYPGNQLQERVYNIAMYWNLYGLAWIDTLIHSPLLETHHQVVKI